MGEKIEEMRRKLAENKKQKEKAFDEFKGFIKGVKASGELSLTEKNIVYLFEFMMTGFNNIYSDVGDLFELAISSVETANKLQTRVKELEEGIFQLRTTFDKLSELK